MPEFIQRSLMPASAEELFAWHARSGAFERLLPPWEQIEVRQHPQSLANGDRAELVIRMGPLRQRMVAEHHALPDGIGFRDAQLTGPFAKWEHTHRMTPADAGNSASWLEDRIHYDVPFGTIGRALVGRHIRQSVERTFAYRHRITAADLAAHQTARDKQGTRAMNILVTGSTGLVGSAVVPFLTTGGHRVVRLVRGTARGPDEVEWNPQAGTIDAAKLEGLDAVVHLAGENIATGRWNDAKKAAIRDSRVNGTSVLCEALAKLTNKPRVLVGASAIGFYGERGDTVMTESSPPGLNFLCNVCRDWEAATGAAKQAGIRVVNLRIGVVLTPRGGALAKMLTPFKLCVGGIVGSGRQYWSWIALDDVVGAIYHAITHDELSGPVNAVSPEPLTNAAFTKILGRVLHRPTIAPLPVFVVKLLLGEMGEELLLASTRVVPTRLEETGYQFRCPTLEGALRHLLGR
jgi:uncharacterized protein (TIGR01777 family)